MTTPDLRRAGLDPAHILAICEHVAASDGWRPVGYVTAVPDGVRVRLRSPRAARAMRTALTRTGYDTALTRPGRHWDLLVTGWDDHALETRLTAMRTVIQQLAADPTATATAVIDRYRQMSARSPARLGILALVQASEELRATVTARCGIPAPRDPAVRPAEIGNALRLRAIWVLEKIIDDLLERHLRIARRALTLFRTLRQDTTDDRAQETAISRAVGFLPRPSGSAARDTAAHVAPPLQGPRSAASPAIRDQAGRRPCGPGRQAALDFPITVTDATAAAGPARMPLAGPPGSDPRVRQLGDNRPRRY